MLRLNSDGMQLCSEPIETHTARPHLCHKQIAVLVFGKEVTIELPGPFTKGITKACIKKIQVFIYLLIPLVST